MVVRTASPSGRVVLAAGVCALTLAMLLQGTLPLLQDLSPTLNQTLSRGYFLGALLMTLTVALTMWVMMWPLQAELHQLAKHPEQPAARAAKASALSCPLWVTTTSTGMGLLLSVLGSLLLSIQGMALQPVLELLLLTMSVLGLFGLLLYGLVQRAMVPLLEPLRVVAPPAGPWRTGSELQGRMILGLLAIVGAGVTPALLLTAQSLRPQAGWWEHGEPLALLAIGAAVLLLGLLLAATLSQRMRQDLGALQDTVIRLAEARLDVQVRLIALTPKAALHEVRDLQQALFDLIDRARRLQVEIFLATERSIEARRAKSQYLAATSHDLRNALSPVLGFTDLLGGGYQGNLQPQTRVVVQRMQRQGRRLLRTLSEILDTAKAESQTIELQPRECSASELLTQAVSEVRRLRAVERLPIRIELPAELPHVLVDPLRFPQALAYLCGHVIDSLNADELDPEKESITSLGELRLSAWRGSAGMLVFEIAHIPSAQHPATGPALGISGLGLALPLARRLLGLHRGHITVVADVYPRLRASVPAVDG